MEIVNDVIEKLSDILLFLNVALYSYTYFKKNRSKAVKYLAIYLTLSFCFSIASDLILYIQRQFNIERNNLFLTHYYFIFQFIFLSLFYSQLFTKRQKKHQIIISVLVFLILLIQYSTNVGLYYKFNLLEILICLFPLIIYSVFHLYNALSKTGKFMYINAGILAYLSISTLIYILGNFINIVDQSLSSSIWFLNRVFYLGYLILFIIEWKKSLWKMKN